MQTSLKTVALGSAAPARPSLVLSEFLASVRYEDIPKA